MSSPNTLLVDGTDIRGLTGVKVVGAMDLFAPGTRRGSHDVIPGRAGQVGAELPYDAYSFSIPVRIFGATREAMIANLRAVGTLLAGTNGLVSLERRLAKVGGGYDAHTAAGQFVTGLGLSLLNPATGRTELQFINLDGAWFDASAPTVPIVP